VNGDPAGIGTRMDDKIVFDLPVLATAGLKTAER